MRLQPLCFPSTLRTLREVACFLGDNSVLVFLCDGKDDRQLPSAPREELGAAGFLPPGVLTQIQTKSVLFPSVQVWGSTSNQHLFFFFFLRRTHQKNRSYGHFYRSWANTLATVKQIHFLSTLLSGRSLRL